MTSRWGVSPQKRMKNEWSLNMNLLSLQIYIIYICIYRYITSIYIYIYFFFQYVYYDIMYMEIHHGELPSCNSLSSRGKDARDSHPSNPSGQKFDPPGNDHISLPGESRKIIDSKVLGTIGGYVSFQEPNKTLHYKTSTSHLRHEA